MQRGNWEILAHSQTLPYNFVARHLGVGFATFSCPCCSVFFSCSVREGWEGLEWEGGICFGLSPHPLLTKWYPVTTLSIDA